MELNQLTDPKEVLKLAQRIDAIHIGHELVLSDNIDNPMAFLHAGDVIGQCPVKIIGASISMCLNGSITYRINLSRHTLNAGEILVILPGSIMQVLGAEGDLKTATISFASQYYEPIIDVNPQMRDCPVIKLPENEFRECVDIFLALKRHVANDAAEVSRSIAKGYLRVLCSITFNNWHKQKPLSPNKLSRPKELYSRFLVKVQQDYRVCHAVKHYADTLCVTPKYLSMVVKRESGRNAADFINELIIFESKALLTEGGFSIQQVSEMMNFPNPSFFSKFFRQQCGLTPSGYRNLYS